MSALTTVGGQPFGLLRLLASALVVAVLLVGGAGALAAEQSWPVGGFTKVAFSGHGNLQLVQDGSESLRADGDQDALDLVTVETHGDTLRIAVKDGSGWLGWMDAPDQAKLQFQLHVKQLQRLELAGATKARADSLNADDLTLVSHGAVDIHLAGIQAQKIRLKGSGASTLRLSGLADELDVHLSGAGDLKARGLVGNRVQLDMSGASDAEVHAIDTLAVQMSGASSVYFLGQPSISKRLSGAASIEPLAN